MCSVSDIHGIVSTIDDDYSSCVAVAFHRSLNASLVLLMECFHSLMHGFSAMRIQSPGALKWLLEGFTKFD